MHSGNRPGGIRAIPLIEPAPVGLELISGLHEIVPVGPLACFVCYQQQMLYEGGEPTPVRVISRRMCIANDDLLVPVQMALSYLSTRALTTAANYLRVPHLRQ